MIKCFVKLLQIKTLYFKKNTIDEMNASTLTSAASGTIFKFGPFIVGLLFGLIGVGLVYIFTDDKDSRRSAWYGLGTWLILLLLLVSAAGA